VRVLVTGGAGFIGVNLCEMLSAAPAVTEVVVLDDLSTGDPGNLTDLPDVCLVRGSILDDDALRAAVDGVDSVVHLAARASVQASVASPLAIHEINATGTVRVLEAARRGGVSQVVVASSSAVYGGHSAVVKNEVLPPDPISPYAASKLATEAYALAYARCYRMYVLPLRFFNVFGPRQPPRHEYAAVIPAFLSAALAGRPLTIFGDGRQTRDFVYVESVAAVLTAAVLGGVASRHAVNVASGTTTSLLQVADVIRELLGRDVDVVHLPARPGDIRHSRADTTSLRKLFGGIDMVDLRTGLSRTLTWLRRQSPAIGNAIGNGDRHAANRVLPARRTGQ
jgi:UDP-glucose 4-epimerase